MSLIEFGKMYRPMRAAIRKISKMADGILGFELVSEAEGPLAAFTCGAHIDVIMPNGVTRQYSLVNQSGDDHYHICVNLDPASRGGSSFMHEVVAEGDVLEISAPRNNFPLHEAAPMSILIAGGIGITPIYAMAAQLAAIGRPWRLYHCTRNVARTPFVKELRELAVRSGGELVHVHDGIPGIRPLDIAAVVDTAPADTHFYCCGPKPLMDAFAKATARIATANIHTEHFTNAVVAKDDDSDFTVVCARSNRSVVVPKGVSILAALEAQGMAPLCSCREGICGTCETNILAGQPDHRDAVLTPDERESGETMMICVSRAKGKEITLDI